MTMPRFNRGRGGGWKGGGSMTRGHCVKCVADEPVYSLMWLKGAFRPKCSRCGWTLERRGQWKGGKAEVVVADVPSDILYPDDPTEFEIHSVLYTGLRALGIDARCQVKVRGGSAVLDIVIFEERKAVLIIEVKRAGVGPIGKQVKRYAKYGVPVVVVRGEKRATKMLEDAAAGLLLLPRKTPSATGGTMAAPTEGK